MGVIIHKPIEVKKVDDPDLYQIVEVVNSTVTFIGESLVQNANPASPIWKIKRVSVSGIQTITEKAVDTSGVPEFNQVFDDRASLFGAVPFGNSYSVQFDGANDSLQVADAANIQFDRLDTFSVSVWFKSTKTGTAKTLWAKEDGVSETGYQLRHNGTASPELEFQLRNAGGDRIRVTGDTEINDGFWHHVLVTYDGSSVATGVKMYVDGVAETLNVDNDTLTATTISTDPLAIGSNSSGGSNYQGNIDEFAIWDVELTPANAVTLYNSGAPTDLSVGPSAASLVIWLRMGDGDVFPTISDQVGVNDGTMINMSGGDFETEVPV